MHRIAICDDDAAFAKDVASCVRDWCAQHDLACDVCTYHDGDALLSSAGEKGFDLVFLDMIMPLASGMDTARELRAADRKLRIVFLTSSPEFALESYEVKAADYLLKPVSPKRIGDALDEWLEAVRHTPRSLVVKTADGFQRLDLDAIEYVEAQGKRTCVAMRDGRLVEASEAFGSLEAKLEAEPDFFRCHRSYLVNLSGIDHFTSTDIFTRANRCIPVARNCRKAFQEAYFSHRFEG